MILLYWPMIVAIHFVSAATMGIMAVLSGKALRDMVRRGPDRADPLRADPLRADPLRADLP